MYGIKGGWVRQTFALASCNDSGGKKSRIRRSKEERKALVESFIKKHQNTNNGSFPSLNLTHKEVGGSFYTVREIVREVIQENKVLGPGILTPEQQNQDYILDHDPIGSIATGPENQLLSSNGSHLVTHVLTQHQDANEKLVTSANLKDLESEHHSLGEALYSNGSSEVFLKSEDHGRAKTVTTKDKEVLVLEESVEDTEASCTRRNHLEAALVQETSSLTFGSGITHVLDDKFSILNGSSGEKRGESVVDGKDSLLSVSGLINEDLQLEKSHILVNENLVGKVEVPVQGNLDISTIKNTSILPNHHQSEKYARDMSVVSGDKESLELEKSVEDLEVREAKATDITAEMEEAFLSPPDSGRTCRFDEKPSDASVLIENFGRKGESSVADDTNFQASASGLTDASTIANVAVQQLKDCCDLVMEKPRVVVEDPLKKTPEVSMIKEDTVLDTSESFHLKDKDASAVEIKIRDAIYSINYGQRSKDTKIGSSEQNIRKKAIATESNPNIKLVDELKEAKLTLDRINLESWETTSDKPQKAPSNPLFVFFEALVSVFEKFWSK